MPVMDGITTTKKIRSYLKNVIEQPMIVGVTGHIYEGFKQSAIKAGMNKVVPKPLYLNVIMEIL